MALLCYMKVIRKKNKVFEVGRYLFSHCSYQPLQVFSYLAKVLEVNPRMSLFDNAPSAALITKFRNQLRKS